MARQRRGGGFSLDSLLKQAGTIKDVLGEVLDRGAREGRARLEELRSRSDSGRGGSTGVRARGESRWGGDGERRSTRKRAEAVSELGELVLQLIRDGEIDLGELPEARDLVDYLDGVDGGDSGGGGYGDEPSSFGEGAEIWDQGLRTRVDDDLEPSRGARASFPPARSRFDERRPSATSATRSMHAQPRSHAHSHDDGHRHSPDSRGPARPADRERDRDGTVSSAGWAPPRAPGPGSAPVKARHGIRFDENDEDLAEYMHPDDVPSKPDKP